MACGEEVPGGVVGSRVLVDPANYDGSGSDARPVDVLGSERDEGFAEYTVVPAVCAHPIDESPLSDVELAAVRRAGAAEIVDRQHVGKLVVVP